MKELFNFLSANPRLLFGLLIVSNFGLGVSVLADIWEEIPDSINWVFDKMVEIAERLTKK